MQPEPSDIVVVLDKLSRLSADDRRKGAELRSMVSRTVRDREIERVARERQEAAEKAEREKRCSQ